MVDNMSNLKLDPILWELFFKSKSQSKEYSHSTLVPIFVIFDNALILRWPTMYNPDFLCVGQLLMQVSFHNDGAIEISILSATILNWKHLFL